MNRQKPRSSLGQGVYFATEDYVGIGSRVVILTVDFLVLLGLFFLFDMLVPASPGETNDQSGLFYFGFVWAYLTIIKASKIRTVGYWVTGSKILNLRGKRPSVFRMTIRLMLWGLGPFNLFYDLMWAGVDEDRQSLRDRFAGTCVVRKNAEPVGTGEIHLAYYTALGLTFIYPRVYPPSKVESVVRSGGTP